MKGFDRWLETNPFETSDAHIEAIMEALIDDFYNKNEDFVVNNNKFYEIADKYCHKKYFTNFDKAAKLIERLFYLYKLDKIK